MQLQKRNVFRPLKLKDYLNILCIFVFGVVDFTIAYVIISTRNFDVQVYLIPYWSAPVAIDAVIGCTFALACFWKFRDYKIVLLAFLVLDGIWEIEFSVWNIVRDRFNLLISNELGVLTQIFIFVAPVISGLVLRRQKIQWCTKYLLIVFLIFWTYETYFPIGLFQQLPDSTFSHFCLAVLAAVLFVSLSSRASASNDVPRN